MLLVLVLVPVLVMKMSTLTIVRKGSEKRRTAETMMNANSSRSHTVFTITVHVKEFTKDGEEVLRIGKLNLVDLAGSENVGKSGAVDGRAREAGNINQSLLTLGRVITCLVEHAPHIPYRESKLTRLLQDSLGGRTKTSIIATVSPAASNYDETLSTLDYAHRAKNILNKPELNQKLSKTEVLKEYRVEADRLHRELRQVHQQNGVYLAKENWLGMLADITENEKKIAQYKTDLGAIHIEVEAKTKMFDEVEKAMLAKSRETEKVKVRLAVKEEKLEKVAGFLDKVTGEKEEQEHLVGSYREAEARMAGEARQLAVVCREEEHDLDKLHNKKETIATIETSNVSAKESFQGDMAAAVGGVVEELERWRGEQAAGSARVGGQLEEELARRVRELRAVGGVVEELRNRLEADVARQEEQVAEVLVKGGEARREVAAVTTASEGQARAAAARHAAGIAPQLASLAAAVREQSVALAAVAVAVDAHLADLGEKGREQMEAVVAGVVGVDTMIKALEQEAGSSAAGVGAACAGIGRTQGAFRQALADLQVGWPPLLFFLK